MKSVNYPIILGEKFLTVIADKAYSLSTQDSRFERAVAFVKAKDWANFFNLMDKPAAIARYSKGKVKVFNDEIHYDGKPVHGVIADRIIKFMNDGFDFSPLVAFLDNLYLNLDEDIRSKLYLFLENNQLAITERGSFLAFKLVNENGTPIYNSSGTFLNERGEHVRTYKVGEKFFFPKDKIRKTNGECSTEGLYVGNKAYWNSAFDEQNNYTGNGKMLIVEVYPQHVCNVPHSDATKIVVCELKVIDEYKTIVQKANSSLYGNGDGLIQSDGDVDYALPDAPDIDMLWDDLTDTDFVPTKTVKMPKRDAYGRFIKKALPLRDSKGHFIAKRANKKAKRDAKGRFRS